MKTRNQPQDTIRLIILIATLTAVLLLSVTPAAFAKDEYGVGLRVRGKKSEKKAARRSARKHEQKKAEKARRKDTSRDTSRLDYRIDPATVKITDAKIVDRKYRASEMEREREEAKLAEKEVPRTERPPGARRARAKIFYLEREKRGSFYEVGF